MDLIAYNVRIVAPDGELSNVRMDAGLAAVREAMEDTLGVWVEQIVDSREALDGFTVCVEVSP